MKVSLLIVVLCALIFGSSAIFMYIQWPDRYFHFITCDVGQGDGLIFTLGFFQLVMDTGYDQQIVQCLSEYMPFWDRTIELVFITHSDRDHIGGLQEILKRYQVKTVVLNPTQKTNQYLQTVHALIQKESKLQSASQGQVFTIGSNSQQFRFTVLWPKASDLQTKTSKYQTTEQNITQNNFPQDRLKDGEWSENQLSISGVVEYDGVNILLTGDIDVQVEQALVSADVLMDVDILKIAHHGSKTSTSNKFISHTIPEVAVMSFGEDNRFGHPHPSVITTLQAFKVRMLSTVEHGNIEIISDGENYWIK